MKKRLSLVLMLCVMPMQVAVADSLQERYIDGWTHVGKEDADGYADVTVTEKKGSSNQTEGTSSVWTESRSGKKICVSDKCNPSKKNTSEESNQDSKKNEQASSANGSVPSPNEQALQQIINNANNMGNKLANDAATSVVVPPPPPPPPPDPGLDCGDIPCPV